MGGNAVTGVGTIHIDELYPTLTALEKQFGLSNLSDKLFGSVGKKEYSGDIDVVLDPEVEIPLGDLIVMCRNTLGIHNVRRSGNMFSVAYPISGYNANNNARLPRTGYVQVDFVYANPHFTKIFNWSPGNISQYKGVHRNLAISAVAAYTEREESTERDDKDRPVQIIRWKWSPHGFFKILRKSIYNEVTDKYNKTQRDTQISDAILDVDCIVAKMFGTSATAEVLDSFESVLDACVAYFDESKRNDIFSSIVYNVNEYNMRSEKTTLVTYGLPSILLPFQEEYNNEHRTTVT